MSMAITDAERDGIIRAAVAALRDAAIPVDVFDRPTAAGQLLPCIAAGEGRAAVVVALMSGDGGRAEWGFIWDAPADRGVIADMTVPGIGGWDSAELARRVALVLDVATASAGAAVGAV